MLHEINFAADAVIWIAATWVVLTGKILTRTFGSIAMMCVAGVAAINIMEPNPSPVLSDTIMKVSAAYLLTHWFYRVEVKHLLRSWKRV